MDTDKTTTNSGKKTWKNYYWFYYKWHIFFVLFFGIAIAICTVQCANKVNPDCYVLFNSNIFISDQQLDETADELEKFISDLNGDGEVAITPINCTYPKGNQTRIAQVNQLAVLQLQNPDTHIWIVDKKGIELYLNNPDIDIFAEYKSFDNYNNKALSVELIEPLKWLNNNTENNEYFLLARKESDGNITKTAKEFVDNLIK